MSETTNKTFWEDRALNLKLEEIAVTLPDKNQRELELSVILEYLPLNQRILDIGCGNGYSTAILAKYAKYIVGFDYSPSMIERAQRQYGQLTNVIFRVQNILDLKYESESFVVALSQRCLINLSTWEDQQKAIINIVRILKPGGYFFLQEGTCQGRKKLNQVRQMFGLSWMPPVIHNLDFDEDELWPFLRHYFTIVEVRRFGIYDLISRVVHPLLVSPEEPRYDAKINKVAQRVSSVLQGIDELSREFTAILRVASHP